MINKIIPIILFLGVATSGNSQSSEISNENDLARNSVYLEILGTGSLYSINIDRILLKKESFGIAGRVGLTFTPKTNNSTTIGGPGIPLELTGLFGKKNSFLEIGVGAGYHFLIGESENTSFLILAPRLGYRKQDPNGGFFFRFALTPWIPVVIDKKINSEDIDSKFLPMFGMSIGHTFKK